VDNLPAGNYNNLAITVNSCTSQQDPDVVLSSPDAPTIEAVAVQPTTCGASDGEIDFTFTNVPDGTYDITYDGGTFTDVDVASNAATVDNLPAGNYNNLAITVNGCTSQQDPDVVLSSPDAPTIAAVAVQPSTCGASDGEIQFTFENVPDGTYDITYDGGTFTDVDVASNAATVNNLPAGNYNNLAITVNSCTSQQDPDVVLIQANLSITTNVQDVNCSESNNGSVSVAIGDAVFPVTVQLNNMEAMVFNTDSFSIENLSPGNYEMNVFDTTGCQTNTSFEVKSGGPNLGGTVDVMYLCDANSPSNTIEVTLSDPSISNDVLYAMDSTNPDDFILTPDFGNLSSGSHSLFIMHNNGCLAEIPFEVENFEKLELSLTSEYVNQITANVSGGSAPYTYYFDDNSGTSSNTYTINRSGTFTVRVVDSYGCEIIQSTTMNLVEITIPDFFTPNGDGERDFWSPKNSELFPDIHTHIFDRYGREIQILGTSDAWDGEYDSNPMPSGDYWYIVRLNDGSGREFVGHFTLYR
jgi:gliding motility-associated-like protein